MTLHSSISGITSGIPLVGERTRIYLLPGDLRASEKPCQMTTILGSCVAVCLWDAKLKVGGMNHFLLPAWKEGSGPSMRFGDIATHSLLQKLELLGAPKSRLIAKIFGGSALFSKEANYESSLGAKNVEAARLMMKKACIPIVAEDTGGTHGRKIVFHTDDGSAWSRQV